MQHEDKKFIQHKIQYTVAQCRVGVEVSREKRPNEQKVKKEGVTWYLCYYVSTTVLYIIINYNYNLSMLVILPNV